MEFAGEQPGADEIMVIGGETMFDLFKEDVCKVYLTIVHANVAGDTRFDEDFSAPEWDCTFQETIWEIGDEFATTYRDYERCERRKSVDRFTYAVAS